METNQSTGTDLQRRLINFTNIPISGHVQVSLDQRSDEEILFQLKTFADRPVVYLATEDQMARIMSIIDTLGSIHSPCYPHALFVAGDTTASQSADIEIIACGSEEPDAILLAVDRYAESIDDFDASQLEIENDEPLPTSVDVLIVGAGITGLYAAGRLRDRNMSFCVVDKKEKIGGIWSEYANRTSQVNTSEGAYRLIDPMRRANRDHSSTTEILRDMDRLAVGFAERIFCGTTVESIKKQDGRYVTTGERNGKTFSVTSKGVILAINDRVGPPRRVSFENEDTFSGDLVDGFSDGALNVDWRDKQVVVVGMGAFAIENARTALERGARHVTVVCRRHGTVCPKIIDYMNFASPYNEKFEHEKKNNIRNMMLWKRLYEQSGATEPECWMGKIKHTGHTISVSDIWFIAHHLGKLETVTGSVSGMFDGGVEVDTGTGSNSGTDGSTKKRIAADVVVKCVGFERNTSEAVRISGVDTMYNTNYVDKDFMYLADAYIDDDVFNSFFGSSVLEMAKFYMNVYLEFFDDPAYDDMIATDGVEKIEINDRNWSQYIAGADALMRAFPQCREFAKTQIAERTRNFLEMHDLETYIAENKREWIDTHHLLAQGSLAAAEYLPYAFEKLLQKR